MAQERLGAQAMPSWAARGIDARLGDTSLMDYGLTTDGRNTELYLGEARKRNHIGARDGEEYNGVADNAWQKGNARRNRNDGLTEERLDQNVDLTNAKLNQQQASVDEKTEDNTPSFGM